jgi:hypothetical protein
VVFGLSVYSGCWGRNAVEGSEASEVSEMVQRCWVRFGNMQYSLHRSQSSKPSPQHGVGGAGAGICNWWDHPCHAGMKNCIFFALRSG